MGWVLKGNLKGPKGDKGDPGAKGESVPQTIPDGSITAAKLAVDVPVMQEVDCTIADGWSGTASCWRVGPFVYVVASLKRTGAQVNLKQWSDLLQVLTLGDTAFKSRVTTKALMVNPNPMHGVALANNQGRQIYFIEAKGSTLYLRDPTGGQVLETSGWLQFTMIYLP